MGSRRRPSEAGLVALVARWRRGLGNVRRLPQRPFCRPCISITAGFDQAFADRHGDRELLAPAWWDEPARGVQVDYLARLALERAGPPAIADALRERPASLSRGQVCEWIEELKYSERRPTARHRA